MAKETDIAKRPTDTLSTPGSFMPADFESLIGDGFASIDTVRIGAPDQGKLPFYLGKLIGPGEPIQMDEADEDNTMPTWAFHPAVKTSDGKLGFAENVTHIIPAAYMLHAACARINKEAEKRGTTAVVGVMFKGQRKSNKGRPLNDISVFEKYLSKGA